MKKLIKEFKEFISKGNVLDLAVGVIIGSAFQKIVSSLVNDIFMPFLGLITGGHDYTSLTIKFKDATINYGLFIQNIIDFLLMAFCIFIIVKVFNSLKDNLDKKSEKVQNKTDVQVQEKSNEEKLLEEIRDLLKEKQDDIS